MPTEFLQHKSTSKDRAYFGELLQLFEALHQETVAYAIHDKNKLQSDYEAYRNTACYRRIKQDITDNTTVTAVETIFYALVTDNVSSLDPNKLDQHSEIQLQLNTPHFPERVAKAISPFVSNLKILAAALRHQKMPTIETLKRLRALLEERAEQDEHGYNNKHSTLYLNLSGITIFAIPFQNALNLRHCYFAKARLDRELSFHAFYCIFDTCDLRSDINCERDYTNCDLIEVSGIIYVPDGFTFLNTNIIRSRLEFFVRQGLNFINCDLLSSNLSIQGTQTGGVGNLTSCIVHESSISLAYGCIYWIDCGITQSVITSDLERPAKHIFDGKNLLYTSDLRMAKIDDLMKLLNPQKKIHCVNQTLIYNNDSFVTPQAFERLLNDIHQTIDKTISKLFDKAVLVHQAVVDIQVVFAKLIIHHIHAYYPLESFPLEAIALLQEALKHKAFQNQNQIGMTSLFGGIFAACSTATEARDLLTEALNDALVMQPQHTALSRLTSF